MSEAVQHYDVIIIGAGAAGLHCAAHAAARGKSVIVLDHAKQAGKRFSFLVVDVATSPTCLRVLKTTSRITLIL